MLAPLVSHCIEELQAIENALRDIAGPRDRALRLLEVLSEAGATKCGEFEVYTLYDGSVVVVTEVLGKVVVRNPLSSMSGFLSGLLELGRLRDFREELSHGLGGCGGVVKVVAEAIQYAVDAVMSGFSTDLVNDLSRLLDNKVVHSGVLKLATEARQARLEVSVFLPWIIDEGSEGEVRISVTKVATFIYSVATRDSIDAKRSELERFGNLVRKMIGEDALREAEAILSNFVLPQLKALRFLIERASVIAQRFYTVLSAELGLLARALGLGM